MCGLGVDELAKEINRLRSGPVGMEVSERIGEFEELHKKDSCEWFSELCFCILTAYSSAELGLKIQRSLSELGHRFSEKRTHFIVDARAFGNIKEIVTGFSDERLAREWLVKRIKGLGYKEASHFLRNVGYKNVAILDRHVVRVMYEYGLISEVPGTLTRRKYLELEQRLERLAERTGLSLGELDLYLWFMRTGKILK